MIKVTKPKHVPSKLKYDGCSENEKNSEDYMENPGAYMSGALKFNIKNKIYGHHTVKSKLKAAQNNKCCFCEKDLSDEYGAIEHFRPKGGYHSIRGTKIKKPGYYWLAYDWKNLYFSCSGCNSKSGKGNLFPLQDELARAKSHCDDYRRETPLLLNPGGRKNPKNHIVFKNEYPAGKTIFGRKTIEICRIDRDSLNDMRRKLISDIEARIMILEISNAYSSCDVNKAKEFIKDSMKPDAPFSSAAINYIRHFT